MRHGRSKADHGVPPEQWGLDDEAFADIDRLADSGVLPAGALWISSSEPKALETARRLRARLGEPDEVTVADGLDEQRRPAEWIPDFALHIHRALLAENEPVAEGWEPCAEVRARVGQTVHALTGRAEREGVDDLVLVGHSTAWTLLVAELTGRPVDLVAWERLLMPDYCVVESGRLSVPWGTWTEHKP